jgi:hypothetical protein
MVLLTAKISDHAKEFTNLMTTNFVLDCTALECVCPTLTATAHEALRNLQYSVFSVPTSLSI